MSETTCASVSLWYIKWENGGAQPCKIQRGGMGDLGPVMSPSTSSGFLPRYYKVALHGQGGTLDLCSHQVCWRQTPGQLWHAGTWRTSPGTFGCTGIRRQVQHCNPKIWRSLWWPTHGPSPHRRHGGSCGCRSCAIHTGVCFCEAQKEQQRHACGGVTQQAVPKQKGGRWDMDGTAYLRNSHRVAGLFLRLKN